jgi:hypothetical protein
MTSETTGRARGGIARAASLTSAQRSEIARGAAISRWAKDLPRAIATGMLQIGDAGIACAVLDDEKNTRVLTQDGFLVAIGRSKRPNSSASAVLDENPAFLRASNLKPFVIKNIRCSTTAIKFRPLKGGGTEGVALGYEADMLPEVCWVYHDAAAAGKLLPSQRHIAEYCGILLRGLTNVAITALVDEATGFQEIRTRNALQKILERYVTKELQPWVKTFDDEYYKQIFRLNGWIYDPSSVKRPSVIGHWTNDIVYDRLAPGVREELVRLTGRDDKGRLKNKLTQRLTPETGHPALKAHLAAVQALMRASPDWARFKKLLQRAFPRIGTNIEMVLEE